MDILLNILFIWLPRLFLARCCYFAIRQHRWRRAGLWAVGVLYPLPIIVAYWLRRWYLKRRKPRAPRVPRKRTGETIWSHIGHFFVLVFSFIIVSNTNTNRRRWH